MLKTQIIKNTWSCDNCGDETAAEANPYFHITIKLVSPQAAICEVDFCKACIGTLTAPTIVDYVAGTTLLP